MNLSKAREKMQDTKPLNGCIDDIIVAVREEALDPADLILDSAHHHEIEFTTYDREDAYRKARARIAHEGIRVLDNFKVTLRGDEVNEYFPSLRKDAAYDQVIQTTFEGTPALQQMIIREYQEMTLDCNEAREKFRMLLSQHERRRFLDDYAEDPLQ